MKETSKDALKLLYDELFYHLKKNKKLKKNSVLISLFEMKSNMRFEILLNAGVGKDEDIGKLIDSELIEKGYVIPIYGGGSVNSMKYILSGKGIWFIEENSVGMDTLISYLDSKLCGEYKKRTSLSDKEKVIMWTFISLGAFYEKQWIDLKKEYVDKNKMMKALNLSLKFLKENGVISKNFSERNLYGKLGNEHPVSHLIRHTDALPKKTLGIYKVVRPQRYYLDLYNPEDKLFDAEGLSYLYKLIFAEKLGDIWEESLRFVQDIYKDYTIYIFSEDIIPLPYIIEYLEDGFHRYMLNK